MNMAYPINGAKYQNRPGWIDRLVRDELEKPGPFKQSDVDLDEPIPAEAHRKAIKEDNIDREVP